MNRIIETPLLIQHVERLAKQHLIECVRPEDRLSDKAKRIYWEKYHRELNSMVFR